MLDSSRLSRWLFAAVAPLFFIPSLGYGQTCPVVPGTGELPPGRVRNPPGLQFFQATAYNSEDDFYLVSYKAGDARALGINSDGTVRPEILLGPNNNVQDVALAYNPDRNEFLATWRYDDPTHVYGRYLDGNGQPLGTPFFIGTAQEARVAYSPQSGRYIVVYSGIGIGVKYRLVAGDSTVGGLTGEVSVDPSGFSARVAYGSATNRFLIVYVHDFAPPTRADVRGRLITGDGSFVGGVLGIGAGNENQQLPEVGYSSTTDQFMVSFEDWSVGGYPDIRYHFVTSNGAVGSRFNLSSSPGVWDANGPITFNSSTGKLVATYFAVVYGYFREVTSGTGQLGPACFFSYLNAVPMAIAARPDPADPQAAVAFRSSFGDDGVHVSIIHLPPPPPSFSSTVMPQGFFQQPYSQPVPVVGGTHPLTFQLLSGSLPPGLSGPNASTGVVSGTPTTLGTFGPFRVRVTDDDGRSAEADLNMTVTLGPPTPLSPSSDIANVLPTFTWTGVAGATQYNVQIENLTDGGTITIPGVPGTSGSPGSNLPANKDFRWRVQASNGSSVGPFSSYLSFRIDLTPGSAIVLSGSVPRTFTPLTGVTAIDSSGETSASYGKSMVVDGNLSTFWSTPARSVMQTEFITLDLGATKTIDHLRIRSRDTVPEVFPKDFQIQLSSNNVSYTPAATVTNFSASAATWYDFPLAPSQARYIRIWVTKSGVYTNGLFYVQIAEIEASLGVAAVGAIQLTWAAPGDDSSTGTAASYDLRYQAGMSINYDSALQATGEPVPAPAGTTQSFTLTGLGSETFYAIAIKSIDDAGNISPISNTLVFATTGVAPEPVTNLATMSPGLNSMGVQWTAPHEDGPAGGPVTGYDLRYATSLITSASFDAATPVVGEPAPLAPGTIQSMTVTGLLPNTRYYLALKSMDDVGIVSLISNVITGDTLDNVPPAAITDLTGTPGAGSYTKLTGVVVISSSGDLPTYEKERVNDANLSTFWSTPARGSMQNEQITSDLGASRPVGRLAMRSRADLGGTFPVDFKIQVSGDNVNYVDALNVTGHSTPAATWNTFSFPTVTGRYVRVLVTKTAPYSGNGLFYVQIAEIEVYRFDVIAGGISLQWTAPGDDGTTGTAAGYDFRYSSDPILTNSDFASATPVSPALIPTPMPAGTTQTLSVGGLGTEAVLWWAAKTSDERPNLSPLSNSVKVATPGTAPAAVTDLHVTGKTSGSITLSWTAQGDDGATGTAAVNDLRYSTTPITNLVQFNAATQAATPPPLPAGSTEVVTVNGLANETTYYFALRVIDDADLASAPSNVVSDTTLDAQAPAAVADLTAAFPVIGLVKRTAVAVGSSGEQYPHVKERSVDGDPTTLWSTPARDIQQVEFLNMDLMASFSIGRVRMRSRSDLGTLFPRDFEIQVSNDGVSFTTASTVNNFTAAPATWYDFDFPPKTGRYVRILVTESNPYSGNGKFYVQIADLEAYEGGLIFDRVNLIWTAPGDNGTQGTASSFDLRYKTTAIVNDFDFNSAIQLTGEPTPAAPGATQNFTVMNVPAEATLYFAIKTADEVPNVSGLSNVPSLVTPAVPPAAVTTLATGASTATGVQLTWNATGDDGLIGIASSYDVRYRTSPIVTDADFAVATPAVGEPAPLSSGTPQGFTAAGLLPDTLYFFAMKVLDEVGGTSPLSNVVSKATADNAPPVAVTNLAATAGGYAYMLRTGSAVASSGELPGYPRANAVDRNLSTFWSTPGRSVQQQEFMTLDLGAVFPIGRVRLRSRSDLASVFPRDFQFQVSTNGTTFTTVHSENDFVDSPATWYSFDFIPGTGRYLRLLVTETNQYTNGLFYVQLAEVEVYSAIDLSTQATLTWTAPGDNGSNGQAASYDLRYSSSPINNDADFGLATPLLGEPAPKPAGSAESFVASALPGETVLYFALKTTDESGNVSAVSNDPVVTMPPIPPGAVGDLEAGGSTATSVLLDWTASGDDGAVGTANAYDVRYRTSPIVSDADFTGATQATGEPSPDVAGSPESFAVTGLSPDTLYYFALKVRDEVGGTSPLSNVVSRRTNDNSPPAAVSDLTGVAGGFNYAVRGAAATQASGELSGYGKEQAVDRNNGTMWSTPARAVMQQEFLTLDVGAVLNIGRVRLRSRNDLGEEFPKSFEFQVSSNGTNFTTVHSVVDFTAAAGTWYTFDFPPAPGRYVRLLVTESRAYSGNGLFYVQVAEMEISQATTVSDRATLSWTATGDNGTTGTAASYDLRFATTAINNDAAFAAANQASGEPAPQAAGAVESVVVTGLSPNTTYHFALKVTDESGNSSLLSNMTSVTTPSP